MRFSLLVWLIGLLPALTACTVEIDSFDWKSVWEVEEGFSISIDSEGFNLPTAIAFVPNPGKAANDPLYFVTELKGAIKVVTNDRTVHTFAEGIFESDFPKESGMAGICLDREHGYVFVTFAYQDSFKRLRNNIIRFETLPETFSIDPISQLDFTEVFLPYESGESHQIGACQVEDGLLYVSLGDGFNTPQTGQQLDLLLGKIARMTLEGNPVPDNPFYQDDDVRKATNFVWAYGMRNPFGMKAVGDRLFVADNGLAVDRFLEVESGQNYLWDGTDWSTGTNAAFVLSPSVGVVQLDRHPQDRPIFPGEYQQSFFLALSGEISKGKNPGILVIEYSLVENRLTSVPKALLRYRGTAVQILAGLAFGQDGLYFVPILPDQEGRNAVFKITYDPANQHPYTLVNNDDPVSLMRQKGCLGCHIVTGGGAYFGTAGPTLESSNLMPRLRERLHSQAYVQSLEEIDRLDGEPYVSFRAARREVLKAEGTARVRTWLTYRIQEPRFDSPNSQMPNLGVTEVEAKLIADYLVGRERGFLTQTVLKLLPAKVRTKHLPIYFVAGFLFGVFSLGIAYLTLRRLHGIFNR